MAVFPLACEYVGSSVWTIELWFLDFRFGTQSSLRTKRVIRGVSEESVGEGGQKGPLTGGQCSVETLCTRNQNVPANVQGVTESCCFGSELKIK